MTVQQGASLYTQGFGSRPENVEIPHVDTRPPTTTDVNYPIGKQWIDQTSDGVYSLTSIAASAGTLTATWVSTGATSEVATLTGDSGGAISPTGGNIDLLGTTNEISTTGSGHQIQWGLSATMVAPGTLDVTGLTTLAALTQVGTASLNATGAATTTIGSTSSGATSVKSGGTLTVDTAAAQNITIGPTQTSGTLNLGGTGANTGTMTIAGGTGAQTINIGNSTGGKTIAIGTGAGANAVTLGSTDTTSATTINAGSGNITCAAEVDVTGGDAIISRSAAGADVTVEATNSDNTNAASRAGVEIATGGSSSGDPYLSFQISGVGASTMTMGLDNSASDLFVVSNSTAIGTSNALTLSQAGALNATTSITAGTTVTATLGDVTATNGNLVVGTAGNKVSIASGANATVGTSGAMTGGAVTVNNTSVTANSFIFCYPAALGTVTVPQAYYISTITASTSFVITSQDATDTSTWNYWIIN